MTKTLPPKPLSERVADRFTLKKTSVSAQNRAAFLALREDIKQALSEGWKSKNIWETLFDEGKITFSYPTFHNYVKKLILTMAVKTPPAPDQISPAEEKKTALKSQGIPGFTFNPVANKEDLI